MHNLYHPCCLAPFLCEEGEDTLLNFQNDVSHHGMAKQRQSNLVDLYFFTELRSSLGLVQAERWLSETSSPSRAASGAKTPTPALPSEGKKNVWTVVKSSRTQQSRCHSQASSLAQRSFVFSRPPSCESFASETVTLCQESHEFDMNWLMNEYGEKVGLLFTDAAHELLDSPRSLASNCSSCWLS